MHAFLEHLEAVGFCGAPRVLGMDSEGREVLTYLEGEVLADPTWRAGEPTPWPAWAQTEDALIASGELVRDLHEAAASFACSWGVWKQHEHGELLSGEIVCHGDVGPHNTVYRDGLPVGLIDWETIRPNLPLVEFGLAAWHYVPLGNDAYFARSGFGATPDLSKRLRLFAEAYGVTDPDQVLWALQQAKQRSVEAMRFWPISPRGGAAHFTLVAKELSWLEDHKDDFRRALGSPAA